MWYRENFYKYSAAIVLGLLIIFLTYHTSTCFSSVLYFLGKIIIPMLFATILYYVLRPAVSFLKQWMPDYCALLLVFLLLLVVIASCTYLMIPLATQTFNSLSVENLGILKEKIHSFKEILKDHPLFPNFSSIEEMITSHGFTFSETIYWLSASIAGTLMNFINGLMLTPFVLYYFLKDDALFVPFILRYVPSDFHAEATKILSDVDKILVKFIQSQLVLALGAGFCAAVIYLIIGLPYALALALFPVMFYTVPFLGLILSFTPAVIVASTLGIPMVWLTIATAVFIYILDIAIVSPRLLLDKLHIHPLTLIMLLAAAASIYGLTGLLLVTPAYAIAKTIVWNFYKITQLKKRDQEETCAIYPGHELRIS